MTKEKTETVDFTPWCDFQDYLERLDNKVVIPFSSVLVSLLPSVKAVRFRRDFRQILSLIETHAILHQATRERDNQNRIVADIKDYAAVYALVADYIAHSVDACIPASVREAVNSVDALTRGTSAGVSFKAVGDYLNIDKSAAKRRCDRACFLGYLKNNESRKGKPAQLALDEPMPDDTHILPSPAELDRVFNAEKNGDCTVAA